MTEEPAIEVSDVLTPIPEEAPTPEKRKRKTALEAPTQMFSDWSNNWTGGNSETTNARPHIAKFCKGFGLDIGFGGDPVTPNAITMDLPQAYTRVGTHKQVLRGHCGDLSGFCDDTLDFVYSSHLLEDFPYEVGRKIIAEWRRVLKPGGVIVTNCPDQQRFLAHCNATGQPKNDAHYEQDFSLDTFRARILEQTGPWEEVFAMEDLPPYSWLLVVRKSV